MLYSLTVYNLLQQRIKHTRDGVIQKKMYTAGDNKHYSIYLQVYKLNYLFILCCVKCIPHASL